MTPLHLILTCFSPIHVTSAWLFTAVVYSCLSVSVSHTIRAWLISVSLPCIRKVLEQGRPCERHFNPNYVDLKTALDTWGSAGNGRVDRGCGVALGSWILMKRHFKHILWWVAAWGEPANQLLLRHSLSATAVQVCQVSLLFWRECLNGAAKAFKCCSMKRTWKYDCCITASIYLPITDKKVTKDWHAFINCMSQVHQKYWKKYFCKTKSLQSLGVLVLILPKTALHSSSAIIDQLSITFEHTFSCCYNICTETFCVHARIIYKGLCDSRTRKVHSCENNPQKDLACRSIWSHQSGR